MNKYLKSQYPQLLSSSVWFYFISPVITGAPNKAEQAAKNNPIWFHGSVGKEREQSHSSPIQALELGVTAPWRLTLFSINMVL